MADQATVNIQWETDDQTKVATIVVEASGIELDDALDLIADGVEARGYTVTRTRVVEQVTRPGRERRPRPAPAEPVVVAEGEPARIRRVKIRPDRPE
ncbi:MAG: hypothetical protein AB7I38_18895 [Dehalococcoidia bacterium]